jgi:hypothetical protein
MLLGGIRRAEAQLLRDFRARWRHAGFGELLADEMQDLGLSGCEIAHGL